MLDLPLHKRAHGRMDRDPPPSSGSGAGFCQIGHTGSGEVLEPAPMFLPVVPSTARKTCGIDLARSRAGLGVYDGTTRFEGLRIGWRISARRFRQVIVTGRIALGGGGRSSLLR